MCYEYAQHGCSSLVEHLPSICKALSSIPSISEDGNRQTDKQKLGLEIVELEGIAISSLPWIKFMPNK
jgi:hypothetical protein